MKLVFLCALCFSLKDSWGSPTRERVRRYARDPLDALKQFAWNRISSSQAYAIYTRLKSRRSVDNYRGYAGGYDMRMGPELHNPPPELRDDLAIPSKSPQTSSRTTPGPSAGTTPVSRAPPPPPPARPMMPVSPNVNAVPTVQIGAVPNGNRTSYFIGFYRGQQSTANMAPRIQPGANRLQIMTYTYNPMLGFVNYNPWITQTSYFYPVGYPSYIFFGDQNARYQPQFSGRSAQSSGPQTMNSSNTPYVVLYGPTPNNASNVQYTYVPLDDLIGGIRRTTSRLFGFLSRRLRRNRTSSLTADCLDCFD